MYRIEVNDIPPSLNSFYSGMHWTKRKKIVDEWHRRLWVAFRDAKLPKPLKTPLTLNVTQFCKRERDCDNAVILSKFVGDVLVEQGYIKNDTPKYIPCVILQAVKAKEDKSVIIIE